MSKLNLLSLAAFTALVSFNANAAEINEEQKKPALQVQEEAQESGEYDDLLLGDMGGFRETLDSYGIGLGINDTFDVFKNIEGGLRKKARGMNFIAVDIELDGEKLIDAEGLTGAVSIFHTSRGRADSDLVGSAQGIDNLATDNSAGVLYQAYLEQKLCDDKLSILAGLYDINSEIYVTDSAALFLNANFGLGTEMAGSGLNGPSVYPYTSVGTRVKYQPDDLYFLGGIFDGVPGNPNDPNSNEIRFGDDDGALLYSEVGFDSDAGKLGVGIWTYTEEFDHLTALDGSGNPVQKSNLGAYIIGEKEIYSESEGQGLTAFAHFGTANGEVSQVDYSWSTGLNYIGAIPGRDEGQLGLGVTGIHNSDEFKDAQITAGTPADDTETTVELTYADKPTPWMTIQPDVQYVINPGTVSGVENATVVGARVSIDF